VRQDCLTATPAKGYVANFQRGRREAQSSGDLVVYLKRTDNCRAGKSGGIPLFHHHRRRMGWGTTCFSTHSCSSDGSASASSWIGRGHGVDPRRARRRPRPLSPSRSALMPRSFPVLIHMPHCEACEHAVVPRRPAPSRSLTPAHIHARTPVLAAPAAPMAAPCRGSAVPRIPPDD
jgi:hypothetical protein